MKIKNFLKLSILMAVPALIVSTINATLSWFSNANEADVSMSGLVQGSYFESGNGSAETPFEINNPTQLYYFSWLQGLGHFNEPDADGSTAIKQYHFYISSDLNMEGTVLPPIGTVDYPFVGTFTSGVPVRNSDGDLIGFTEKTGTDGFTISNLTIINKETNNTSYNDKPDETIHDSEIVGLFGVLGSQAANVTAAMIENDSTNTTNARINSISQDAVTGVSTPGYTYRVNDNHIGNFYIDGCRIETQTNNALIGIVAGYVNAPITHVGVISSNIYVKAGTSPLTAITSNISDYSIIGYATDDFVDEIESDPIENTINTNTGHEKVPEADAGSAWGGSIDMNSVYKRCNNVSNSTKAKTAANSYYVASTTTVYDVNGNVEGEPVQETKKVSTYPFSKGGPQSSAKFYNSESANGSYNIMYKNTADKNGFCLGGLCDEEMYQEISIIHTGVMGDGFKISSSYGYLSINAAANAIVNTSEANAANATIWNFDSGHIYTQLPSPDARLVYLNNSALDLAIDFSATTNWTMTYLDEDYYTISCSATGYTCYLICQAGGAWKIAREGGFYISDGTNYLAANSTTSVKNVTNVANASIFYKTDDTNARITTYYNGAYRYLYWNSSNASNPLTLSNTTQTGGNYHYYWNIENDGIYYDANHYIIYKNSAWTCGATSETSDYYLISYNGSYLCANNAYTGITSTPTQSSATHWYIANNRIYCINDGTTYYLRHSNQNALGLNSNNSTNRCNWTVSSLGGTGTIYYSSGNTSYYLRVNDGKFQIGTTNSNNDITTSLQSETINYPKGLPYDLEFDPELLIVSTTYEILDRDVVETPGGFPCYIPINALETGDFTVKSNNTGYIISGSTETTQNYRSDIRITHWDKENLGTSLINEQTIDDSNVYTTDDSGRHVINTENLVKYKDSKANYQATLDSDDTYVYGLHFMNAEISKDRTFIAPEVTINNSTLQNYQLPVDCIDFTLQTQGYINFFGANYFTNNNTFFSFHEIFRNSDRKITDIKEIEEIFGTDDLTDPFCYKYVGDDHYYIKKVDQGTSLPTGYSSKFKTSWIKTPGFTNENTKRIYYYELPANPGEYALGSVAGKTGAYLNYLDISANKQMVDRTFNYDETVTTIDSYKYVNGVGFVTAAGQAVDSLDSATYSLSGSYSSSTSAGTSYTRTAEGITVNPEAGVKLEYIGEGVTSTPSESHPSKRQYTTMMTIINRDKNEAFSCDIISEVQFIDKVTETNGVRSAVDRTILVNHYKINSTSEFDPAVDGDEELLLSYRIEHFDGVNNAFNYSYFIDGARFGISIQLKVGTNVDFTFISSSSSYSFIVNDVALSGSASEEEPITRAIAAWTDPFASILDYSDATGDSD